MRLGSTPLLEYPSPRCLPPTGHGQTGSMRITWNDLGTSGSQALTANALSPTNRRKNS